MTRAKFIFFGMICSAAAAALPVEYAQAFVPVMVDQEQQDVLLIEELSLSQAFYGSLENFPHTYEIRVQESLPLYVQVRVPDTDEARDVISGILVKQPAKKGRVEEIARMNAKDAAWERVFDMRGGDHYRVGTTYEAVLEPGVYHLQVYSPDNREKYVLVVGTEEKMTLGYFSYLKRLMEVKKFMGKSPVWIIASPLVYIPLLVIALALCVGLMRRRGITLPGMRYTREK